MFNVSFSTFIKASCCKLYKESPKQHYLKLLAINHTRFN